MIDTLKLKLYILYIIPYIYTAGACLRRSADACHAAGDEAGIGRAAGGAGSVAFGMGDYAAALRLHGRWLGSAQAI